jgi:hypothetical protein
MMSNFVEGKISFSLPDGFKVEKLDSMKFYTEHFQSLQDAKAVDRVVFNPDKLELWLLEVTDYRVSTDRPTGWLDEIVQKVISSLACLVAMRVNSNLEDERIFASGALECTKLRVVLHFEQPDKPSKKTRQVLDSKTAIDVLKKRLRSIDPHAKFSSVASPKNVPWEASF